MNQYNFVPKTPSQKAAMSLSSGRADNRDPQLEQNLSSGPKMSMTYGQKDKNEQINDIDRDAYQNHDLEGPNQSSLSPSFAPPVAPPPTGEGMGMEQKALMTMGLSLLLDAMKDATMEFGDFLQFMNQQAAQRSANRVFDTKKSDKEKEKEHSIIDQRDFKKPNISNELDLLMPGPKNQPDDFFSSAPETPAQKAGIESTSKRQAPAIKITAPTISMSSGPSMS